MSGSGRARSSVSRSRGAGSPSRWRSCSPASTCSGCRRGYGSRKGRAGRSRSRRSTRRTSRTSRRRECRARCRESGGMRSCAQRKSPFGLAVQSESSTHGFPGRGMLELGAIKPRIRSRLSRAGHVGVAMRGRRPSVPRDRRQRSVGRGAIVGTAVAGVRGGAVAGSHGRIVRRGNAAWRAVRGSGVGRGDAARVAANRDSEREARDEREQRGEPTIRRRRCPIVVVKLRRFRGAAAGAGAVRRAHRCSRRRAGTRGASRRA